MKYRIFTTEAEAIAAEAQVAADIGCIKIGTNAKTGQLAPDAQATERWAVPQQIVDGRWVFLSPDDVGVEADDAWWPPVLKNELKNEMEAT
jgi:hypothetical protein